MTVAQSRAPLGATQVLPSTTASSDKMGGARPRTRAAAREEERQKSGPEPPARPAQRLKHTCPSDSDEDERPPRRTSARLGGCAGAPPRTRRRVDDNKENIAPVRSVTPGVLREEAQVRRAGRAFGSAIAMRTRARARETDEEEETQDEAARDEEKDEPQAAVSLPTPPRTPSRVRHADFSTTPSSSETAHSTLFDLGSASSAATTPATTPTKNTPSLYAQARALLRDGAEAPLVGRERERSILHTFLDGWLRADAPATSGCLYISGMPGTGKTALVRSVLAERAGAQVQTALINCVGLSHPHQVATEILAVLGVPRSDDAGRDLEILEAELERRAQHELIIVLDELDHLLHTRVHQNVLYRLFCLPSRVRPSARVGLIGIANSLDLTERFVPLLSSRGVQPEQMQFQPMGAADVCAVVHGRMDMLGIDAPLFSRPALELLARKLTAVSGDLRRALDTCRQALDLAEAEQASKGLSDTVRVQPQHILRVLSHMAGHAQIARVRALGVHAKLLLLAWVTIQERAAAQLNPSTVDGGVRIAELETAYHAMLHDDAGFVSPLETSELLDVLDRLEAQGLIRIYAEATGGSAPQAFSKCGGSRSGTPVRRVSPSGKRAAAKQLLGTNRRVVPSLDRDSIVKALTTRGEAHDEQHTPTVVEAMCRLLRHAQDRVARATLWRVEQPEREHIRNEELGGGRSALPTIPL